jgi:glyoxylase-like metal-dependent hydrolase (beta-lactamase superfamily II)
MESQGFKVARVMTNTPGTPQSNAYVVEGDGLTLIDTGCLGPDAHALFYEAFDNHGWDLSDIERIIITHGHVDHYGFARELADLSSSKVHVHEHDLRKVSREIDFGEQFPELRAFLKRMGMPDEDIELTRDEIVQWGLYAEPVAECVPLKDGDDVEIGRGTYLKVIHAPGHTPGSICLYDEVSNFIFGGDLLLTDRIPNAVVDPRFGRIRGYKSMRSYLSSVQKLRTFPITRFFPGHGDPFDDVSTVIDRTLDYLEGFKRSVLKAMNERDMSPFEISHKLDSFLKGQRLFLHLSDVVGMLEVLEEEGMVEGCLIRGEARFRRSYSELWTPDEMSSTVEC